MFHLKEFYHYKREILRRNTTLKSRLSPKVLKAIPKLFRSSFWKKTKNLLLGTQGILHLKSSANNTIVTLTNLQGKVSFVQSCGCLGFQGKKKRSTKFAIESTLLSVLSRIRHYGWKKVFLNLNGFGKARSLVLTSLKKSGLTLSFLRDTTPIPHNGCRPRKLRRG